MVISLPTMIFLVICAHNSMLPLVLALSRPHVCPTYQTSSGLMVSPEQESVSAADCSTGSRGWCCPVHPLPQEMAVGMFLRALGRRERQVGETWQIS